MPKTKTFKFEGFSQPNFTQIPDDFFDLLAPQLTEAELRVSLYVMRRTLGFKKRADSISLRQLIEGIKTIAGEVLDSGTGMAKPSVLRGLKGLETKGVIVARRNFSRARGHEATTYSLRFREAASLDVVSEEPSSRSVTSPGNEELPALVTQSDTQQTGEQETDEQQTVSSKFNISKGEAAPSKPAVVVENARDSRALVSLPDHHWPKRSERIEVVVEELSADFDDSPHRRANCTQALRLFERSGLSEDAFESRLYEARSITRDEMNRRRLTGSGAPVNNRMAYFFGVLRHELDLTSMPQGQSPAHRQEASL